MNGKIAFIGAGNMGGAIIAGMIKANITDAKNVSVYEKNPKTSEKIASECGVKCVSDIKEVCGADILFLAVKPNVIYSVIEEIRDSIGKNTVIVSIAAGQSIEKLSDAFGIKDIKLVRVMPNTPALVNEAMSAITLNDEMKKEENGDCVKAIISIFESMGKAEIVDEKLMDVVTGVSGSSPAYVFMMIEAMADAAVLKGMPRVQAYKFAAQAVLGSAKMVLESGKHPGELKDMVCSPSGTTIEAVKVLEEKGFRSAIIDAISACVEKSESM